MKSGASPTNGFLSRAPARRKRSDTVADKVRDLIIERDLQPGDRLSTELLADIETRVSKGTMREAMKALETQGLVSHRTGPGGGTFVSAMSGDQAVRLVGNLFMFRQPSIADIYALRKQLEPELVAGLAGRLEEADYAALQQTIHLYDHEPATSEEEFDQRMAELDFHSLLAARCENAVLGFVCTFLHRLLRDIAVCRALYDAPNPQLREVGLKFQVPLVRLLRRGDGDAARDMMRQHMIEAENYMLTHAETARRA